MFARFRRVRIDVRLELSDINHSLRERPPVLEFAFINPDRPRSGALICGPSRIALDMLLNDRKPLQTLLPVLKLCSYIQKLDVYISFFDLTNHIINHNGAYKSLAEYNSVIDMMTAESTGVLIEHGDLDGLKELDNVQECQIKFANPRPNKIYRSDPSHMPLLFSMKSRHIRWARDLESSLSNNYNPKVQLHATVSLKDKIWFLILTIWSWFRRYWFW